MAFKVPGKPGLESRHLRPDNDVKNMMLDSDTETM